jgi:hypothetical protein
MVYVFRRLRETLHLWPYGYQQNYLVKDAQAVLSGSFDVERVSVLHTDWDFPVSAALDRALSVIVPQWGRYILLVARK